MTRRALLALMTAVALLLCGSRGAWAGCSAGGDAPASCGSGSCCGCCEVGPPADPGNDPPGSPCECVDDAPEPAQDLPPALPTPQLVALEPPESWAPRPPFDGDPQIARAPPEVRGCWGPPLHLMHCVFLL